MALSINPDNVDNGSAWTSCGTSTHWPEPDRGLWRNAQGAVVLCDVRTREYGGHVGGRSAPITGSGHPGSLAFAGGIGGQYPPTGRASTRTREKDDHNDREKADPHDDREKDDNHDDQKRAVDHLDVYDNDHDGAWVDHDHLSG